MKDEQLSIKAQAGDEEALNELLARYKHLVNKLARSFFLIGGDIEDIVQEGMIGLYKAVMHYSADKSASFATFAYTCIKHKIQNAVKMANSEKNRALSSALSLVCDSDEDDENGEIELPSNLPSPDDKILEKENFEEMREIILKTLSKLERKILTLYLQGYNYNEMAQLAGISKKSIDNGLSRIKNKLAFLKNEY